MEEGKPQNIAEKMVVGRINKWKKEISFMDQIFDDENKTSVEKEIAKKGAEFGGSFTVTSFVAFALGEGMAEGGQLRWGSGCDGAEIIPSFERLQIRPFHVYKYHLRNLLWVLFTNVLLKLSRNVGWWWWVWYQSKCHSSICRRNLWSTAVGIELAIVIGGGNIFRGLAGPQRDGSGSCGHMGMLFTVINGLAFQDALEGVGCKTSDVSDCGRWDCRTLHSRRALRHMEKGRVIIFAAGTGNLFFHRYRGSTSVPKPSAEVLEEPK